jgi:hypothetical protein
MGGQGNNSSSIDQPDKKSAGSNPVSGAFYLRKTDLQVCRILYKFDIKLIS